MSKLELGILAFIMAVPFIILVAIAAIYLPDDLRDLPSCESIFGRRQDAHGTQADYDASVMVLIKARRCDP